MSEFTTRPARSERRTQWARRHAGRLFAAGVCGAAAASFVAGAAPGIAWALLLVGAALALNALISS